MIKRFMSNHEELCKRKKKSNNIQSRKLLKLKELLKATPTKPVQENCSLPEKENILNLKGSERSKPILQLTPFKQIQEKK